MCAFVLSLSPVLVVDQLYPGHAGEIHDEELAVQGIPRPQERLQGPQAQGGGIAEVARKLLWAFVPPRVQIPSPEHWAEMVPGSYSSRLI